MEGKIPREQGTIPNGDQTSRGSSGGKKFKVGKFGGAELFNEGSIKTLTLSFLKTDNVTARLLNFASESNPFFFRIDSPDIPIQDLPSSFVIH